MGLFSSTAADLKSVEAAKAEAEAAVAALAVKRSALLEQDGDPVSEIAKIDSQNAALQGKISIYTARSVVLQDKLKRQHQASREEAKKRWLGEITKRFDRVVAGAEKLDGSLERVKADYAELIAADGDVLALDCADFLPHDKNSLTLIPSLRISEIRELSSSVSEKWVRGGLVHELSLRQFDLASRAKEMRRLLLEVLDETPIPETDVEPQESAA